MSEKSLKSHAIKIQGKEYITVASRVIYFNEIYPQGAIHTELLTNPESDFVLFKATVYPDIEKTPQRAFIGHSQATWDDGYINKTSAIENAETSSIGRALAAMGIGVIESIASADEIQRVSHEHNIQIVLASRRRRGRASISIVGGTMLQSLIAIDLSPFDL